MNIEEMHVMFRELAQQMGQQTARAIFPEDIDICINASISNLVKSILTDNVGINFVDKISRQNADISPLNALRTLYKYNDIDVINGEGNMINPYNIMLNNDVMIYTSFSIAYDTNNLYECRIIEKDKLSQTLNDFCNRATKRNPICTISSNDNIIKLELYTGINKIKPILIRCNYIKQPAIVYLADSIENNVDCDLPEYLHINVVEGAVKYYLSSVGAIGGNNTNPN